jgi:hypothetical protein
MKMNRLACSLVAWCALASARPLFLGDTRDAAQTDVAVHLDAAEQDAELDALLDAALTVVLSAGSAQDVYNFANAESDARVEALVGHGTDGSGNDVSDTYTVRIVKAGYSPQADADPCDMVWKGKRTALHGSGEISNIKELYDGDTPASLLSIATSQTRDGACVEALLAKGADATEPGLLDMAAASGDERIVRLLVAHGAPASAGALEAAAASCRQGAMEALVQLNPSLTGAAFRAWSEQCDGIGGGDSDWMLDYAWGLCNTVAIDTVPASDVAWVVQASKIDVNARVCSGNLTALELAAASNNPTAIKVLASNFETPMSAHALVLAAERGAIDAMRVLLAMGMLPNAVGERGQTPIAAARAACQIGAIQLLVQAAYFTDVDLNVGMTLADGLAAGPCDYFVPADAYA